MSKDLLLARVDRVPQMRIRECWLDQKVDGVFQQTFEAIGHIEEAVRETRRCVLEFDKKVDIALVFAELACRGGPEDFER